MKVTIKYAEVEYPEDIATAVSINIDEAPNAWLRGFFHDGPLIVHSIEIEV